MNEDNDRGENNKKSNRLLGIGLAMLLVVAAFFSGMQVGGDATDDLALDASLLSFFTTSSRADSEANLSEFWRVWNILEDKFVTSTSTDSLSADERVMGAIAGLVDSYDDPYTVYLPPEDAEQFAEDISGNFSGVGMEVGTRQGLITVIAPLADSPAENAGVLAGDVVVRIDGESTDSMTIDEAVQLIRGEQGTEVELTVYREGEQEFRTINIVRDVITIPTLETETKGDVFVITLHNFNALSETKMAEALLEYKRSGYNKLILDLRGNPGGFLKSSVAIASYFLPAGKVVVRENFGGEVDEQIYRTEGKQVAEFNSDNFVVLIDNGSASASEIVAGSLSEHGAATTIGQNTFGKGSVQELIKLPSGASVKVTVARWLTPNGVSFSEGGLEPNVLITRTPQQVMDGEDTQMDAALDWLSGNQDIGEVAIGNDLDSLVQ